MEREGKSQVVKKTFLEGVSFNITRWLKLLRQVISLSDLPLGPNLLEEIPGRKGGFSAVQGLAPSWSVATLELLVRIDGSSSPV